ncbi:MAG: nucleotide excision repair endonuclease, partial [Phycisphaerae bacterium]|nr:nucleotide excision repair endonuclease [Phycisphaerae bacterium]
MPKDRNAIVEKLRRRAAALPPGPGVYLFKDLAGRVLYVGKAKNLRARVAGYLQGGADLGRARGAEIQRMIEDLAADIDWLECDSEVDALLRENRLIKDI